MPKLPWNLILNQLPTLVRAVDTLIDSTSRRNAARDTVPALENLAQRLTAAEDEQRMSAGLLKQVAENVTAVALAAEASAATVRRVQVIASAALVLALIAAVLAIVALVRG